ncbi:ABC transporter ATP-binding protein [Salinibacillus xinjiangensis]|uniref:ATP-binding cassette domain-containing protein n=1 Tax=Salinibacillus xinjiangensis TaxID=1229268 RepID=A0A6G1X494_9BACI|nr:ABC transporter ATP-binding protein [Salinibacillus xinjiangensis]MRG85767.1 ATP-binding cassette domain-containing protein [Salinibacillus xinjiangensis]
MEILSAHDVSFTYPESSTTALKKINVNIQKGDFVVLIGASGSGKSTLLRLIKQDIAPHGKKHGSFCFQGKQLEEHAPLTMAKEIGMVFQDPENQIAMDNVMEELLFGLENLGYSTVEMRKKVAEMVHFFGINHLLNQKVSELSGGQKQLINLASVLLLEPTVLLLDEPTAQLDPIAAKEFLYTLQRLNDEFGITIVIVEHRLEDLFAIANRVIMLEKGRILYDTAPRKIIYELMSHETMRLFLPSPSLLYLNYTERLHIGDIPLTANEARSWLQKKRITSKESSEALSSSKMTKPILELKEIDFQYTKSSPPILHNLSLSVHNGEWLAIVGANGTGKTTLLKILGGILKAQHGTIKYCGKKVKHIDPKKIGYLPQNPKLFFMQDTIKKEFLYIANYHRLENADVRIEFLLDKFQIHHLQDRHPYDLSGGEMQKAALIGVLLVKPSILLIDEPTKGLDPKAKEIFGELLLTLKKEGLTIIMVTHDIEFAAKYATRCSMLFQGEITVTENTSLFFQENNYYTTVMNRITRNSHIPPVVTLEEARQKWHIIRDS